MSNFQMNADFFDSRDVITYMEELEALEAAVEEARESGDRDKIDAAYADFGPDEADELAALREFADEASWVPDWDDGATFIRDSYFPKYAKELVDDCGYIPSDLPSWLAANIDWDGVANALKKDYTDVELDGTTYWVMAY